LVEGAAAPGEIINEKKKGRVAERIAGHMASCPCGDCEQGWRNAEGKGGGRGAAERVRNARLWCQMEEARRGRVRDRDGELVVHLVAYSVSMARGWGTDPKGYSRALIELGKWRGGLEDDAQAARAEAARRRGPTSVLPSSDDEGRKRLELERLAEWERTHAAPVVDLDAETAAAWYAGLPPEHQAIVDREDVRRQPSPGVRPYCGACDESGHTLWDRQRHPARWLDDRQRSLAYLLSQEGNVEVVYE